MLFVAFVLSPAPVSARSLTAETPVEKVVQLLGRLEKQISEEGAREAAEYDKFACFCKDQVDSKTHAVEKSEEKIGSLKAAIEALGAEIVELDNAVVELGKRIGKIEEEVKGEKEDREVEHDKHVTADKNVTEAIGAVESAIRSLKASKSKMAGSAKVDFAQLAQQLTAASRQLTAVPANFLAVVASATEPGKPAAYEYQSNDVIATLQSLKESFKENKQALDQAEFEAKAAFDKKVLALSNEKKFKEKSKLEKEELSAEKSEEKHEAEQDKNAEVTAMQADIAFRTELTSQCQSKAEEWDSRSKSRANELTALAEATEMLKTGVSTTYGANKKLVGLAAVRRRGSIATGSSPSPTLGAAVALAHRSTAPTVRKLGAAFVTLSRQRLKQNPVAPPVLLQLTGGRGGGGGGAERSKLLAVQQTLVAHLATVANRLDSTELRGLVARAELQEDHFSKVRGLISDLIGKLEQEALDEADHKSFCDKEMSKAVESRDEQALKIEDATAKLSSQEAKKAQLQDEIRTLSAEIADLSKALQEATELRRADKEDNEKTLAEAAAGKAAVEQAISVLEGYYGSGGSFLLERASRSRREAPKADRDGNTVDDLAPEATYSGEYTGKGGASKGILGLLNVILSDFDRTGTTVKEQEDEAQKQFDGFKTETEGSIEGKGSEKGSKEGEVETAESEIVAAKDAIASGRELHEIALKELEKLKAMCVDGEESFAERKAKREQEIEALKEALKILQEWQG